jgi:hypothetical protein
LDRLPVRMPASAMAAVRSPDWVPPGYEPLLASATAVFEADERVRAMWVHGSVARGDADEVSDLDVIVAVRDQALAEFAAGWRERLAGITATVMARSTFGATGSWLSITPGGLRFDLWVEPVSQVGRSEVTDRRLVFDRDGLEALVPAPREPAPASQAKLDDLRAWASDCLALCAGGDAGALARLELVHTLRWILYEAMAEANRPLPVIGLKQWSAKLTAAQRRQFEGLPTDKAAPVLAALEGVLGSLLPSSELPVPARLAVVPEGYIRGVQLTSLPAGRDRLRALAEECRALHLYLAVVLHRADWLLGVEGVYSLRRLLYELFLEVDGRPPLSSFESWDDRLAGPQRDELLELSTGLATRAGVIAGHMEVADAFARHAKALLGNDYPAALEQAVASYVARFV